MKVIKDYYKAAELWNEFFGTTTPATDIKCEINACYLSLVPTDTNVPGDTFYHMDKVVDFCRVYNLGHIVTWNKYNQRIEVHLF